MPIWDEDHPVRPPPERPDPEPEPPSDEPGWIDPGLLPGDPVLPQPEPEPEPEPEPDYEPVGFLLLSEAELTAKRQTYGGVGTNCRSRSTNWADMASMPYWMQGAIDAPMSGSTVTLDTNEDSWMPDDSVSATVAPDSYVILTCSYSASDATGYQGLQDSSFSFTVCLEDGDSLSASVSSGSVTDFSIVKNGVECLNYSEFAAANAIWTKFIITLTIDKAVHCSGAVEQDPEDWALPPTDDPIDDENGSGGGDGAGGGFAWSQADSWVLLGVLVLILLGRFVLDTVRDGGECE